MRKFRTHKAGTAQTMTDAYNTRRRKKIMVQTLSKAY